MQWNVSCAMLSTVHTLPGTAKCKCKSPNSAWEFSPIYSQLFHVPCVDARALPYLALAVEISSVVLSCFMLSRWTIFWGVSLIKLKDSFSSLFKAILHSLSWVKKLLNMAQVLLLQDWLAGCLSVAKVQTFLFCLFVFWNTTNVIKVQLYMMVILAEVYVIVSLTLALF